MSGMRMVWLVVATLLAACTPSFELTVHETPIQPYASAGTGGEHLVGTVVMLDGSASFDPDGSIARYEWDVMTRPAGSMATIADATTAMTTYTLDVAGAHVLLLTVTDNDGLTASSTVTLSSAGPQLLVDAGGDAAVSWQTNVGLSGMASVQSGFSVTGVAWTIESGPVNGATLTNATTLTPTFVCTLEGTYVVRLTAMTEFNSASDDITIACTAPRQLLPSTLVDAEYSSALDRYVLVSSGPAKLHLHDPATGTATTVDLPYAPTAVSVSPDGLRAADGHAGYLTTVNLATVAVITTYTLTINIGDVVYGSDNRIHCFDRAGFGAYPVTTVNTTNGAISNNNSMAYADGYTQARLHPGGTKVYATRTGSPDDILAFDVSTAPITSLGDSPYHGQYTFGGNVWFTNDGVNIITPSGNIFYSSTNPQIDMTYRQKLSGTFNYIWWVVHSTTANEIAVLSSNFNTMGDPTTGFVETYSPSTFAATSRVDIPPTRSGTSTYDSVGRWAAYRADGSVLYVIARASTGTNTIFTLFPLL